jgi:predicted dienelactone hydrolase
MRPKLSSLFKTTACAAFFALGCEVAPPDVIVEVPDDGKLGAGPDEAVDPSVAGPFAVGVTTFAVEDPTRLNPLTGAPRRLLLEVWYPAVDASLALPREDYGFEDLLTPEQLAPLGIDPAQEVRIVTNAGRDAEARADQGPYPMVIFSHGNGGIRVQSVFLTVHLASHGYVVVALDHEGNTLSDLFEAGSGLPDDLLAVAQARPADVEVVINEMLTRNETDGGFFSGLIDADEIGITGHSFGGYTSMASAVLDPRIKASAPLAPPNALALAAVGVGAQDTESDTLILAGGRDLTLPFEDNQQSCFDTLPNERRLLLNLVDAGHFTFSDVCVFDLEGVAQLAGIDTQGVLADGCGVDNLDPLRGQALTNTFVTAFFNSILRDSFPSRLLLRELLRGLDPAEVEAQVDLSFSVAP